MTKLLYEIWTFFQKLGGDNPQAFMLDVAKAFSDLNNAKTPEDHYVVAESLAELVSRMRKPSGS